MDVQVLVAYATKYGATAEIAAKIGQVLREAGLQPDVLPADRVGDLAPYQAGCGGQRGLRRTVAQGSGHVPRGEREVGGRAAGVALFQRAHGRG